MTTGSVSSRRADTRRNNERILAAALESLTNADELSYNAIAKRACVGVGTVYRHFPNPEALVLAVYRREVRHLVDAVPDLLAEYRPEQAFRLWTSHLASYMMTKRGLADALSAATAAAGEDFTAGTYEAMVGAITTLLDACVEAGAVRPRLDPRTVLLALAGLMHLDPAGDWQRQAADITDLLWNGLRG
ncbi:TetR/AcrR family transcriptional regulator [Actinophytocola oryzae]|uniref:TetR/AcrR family transcriptional regulator n=1 Tax=Actinophytocola oryzae TaxID=502181 RepID=UPI001062668C|nr:TetR/AcrR family transcriptional regulator [Actinophytocola oryzae]